MSQSGSNQSDDSGYPDPPYFLPAVRCALEMTLVGVAIALLGLPAEAPLRLAVVSLATFAGMMVVLFWCLNKQMNRWIKYAQGKPTY